MECLHIGTLLYSEYLLVSSRYPTNVVYVQKFMYRRNSTVLREHEVPAGNSVNKLLVLSCKEGMMYLSVSRLSGSLRHFPVSC